MSKGRCFTRDIKSATSLHELERFLEEDFSEATFRRIYKKAKEVVRAKDMSIVERFCFTSTYEKQNFDLAKFFFKKFGFKDLFAALTFCKIFICGNIDMKSEEVRQFFNKTLTRRRRKLVIPKNISVYDIYSIISDVNEIMNILEEENIECPTLNVFVDHLIDIVVARIGVGRYEKFLEGVDNQPLRSNFICGILHEKTNGQTLASLLKDREFHDPRGVYKEALSAYILLVEKIREYLISNEDEYLKEEYMRITSIERGLSHVLLMNWARAATM